MRKFFITDLHGCYEGLVQCLDRCGFDKEKDMLISGGDICDGYSDVCEIVDLFLSIKNAVFITGNHDQWFIEWLEGGVHPDRWKSGGEGTLKSYVRRTMKEFGQIQHLGYDENGKSWGFSTNLFPEKITKELKSHADFFLKKQRRYYIDDDGNLFIHGGFNRHFNLEDQNSYTFMWDRDLWNSALSYQELMNQGDDGYEFKIHQKFKDIFIGHTTTMMYALDEVKTESGLIIPGKSPIVEPMRAFNIWNCDTGAGFDGKATIMNVDTKEYFQSDWIKDLYPFEQGRRKNK